MKNVNPIPMKKYVFQMSSKSHHYILTQNGIFDFSECSFWIEIINLSVLSCKSLNSSS